MSDENPTPDETTTEGPTCSKCGNVPPGPGGILCPDCLAMIKSQGLPEVAGG